MKRSRRGVRPFSVIVVALVISVFCVLGLRVGRSERISAVRGANAWATAAAAAYSHARGDAYRLSWQSSYRKGWSAGVAAAGSAGAQAGRAAADARLNARATAARALAAALQLPPIKLTRKTRVDRCVPVGGGLCEVLGPGVTGKPCPTGSIPDPEGGVVCVPRVLTLAARLANVARKH